MKTINATGGGADASAAVRAAAERGEAEFEVLLDDPVSAAGVMRFLESKGYGVELQDDEGTVTISARKGGKPLLKKSPSAQPAPPQAVPVTLKPIYAAQPSPRPNVTAQRQPAGPEHAYAKTLSVLVTRDSLGSDTTLGKTLMKNFLSALAQMERPPVAVALMNEGVKLSRYDSSSCDHLKSLESKGVSVLVSGTCANYFNIMDEIGAGSISGVPEIVETVNGTGKVITL